MIEPCSYASKPLGPPLRDTTTNEDESTVVPLELDEAREDYEELRRQITKHSMASGARDEEKGFNLEKFLRGMLFTILGM